MINSKTSKKNFKSTYSYSFKKIYHSNMIDFIKYFFRIKKINFLLTFLSLLNFGIMFGAEEDKEEYKIKIKFEKKDKVEKEPFTMFLENFCQTFGLNVEYLNTKEAEKTKYDYFENSKYDFCFYYRDREGDKVFVATDENFGIFYNNPDSYENVSKFRHLFFKKKEDNNNIKAYDKIINNENFKNIFITVYIDKDINEDIEEEKKEEPEEKKKENNHIENNFNGKGDKKDNGNVNKNNDCSCYKCCLDCCIWFTAKALDCLPN